MSKSCGKNAHHSLAEPKVRTVNDLFCLEPTVQNPKKFETGSKCHILKGLRVFAWNMKRRRAFEKRNPANDFYFMNVWKWWME